MAPGQGRKGKRMKIFLKKIRTFAGMVLWTLAGMAGAQPSSWGSEPTPEDTERGDAFGLGDSGR
jgi:hypothetical protein